MAGISTSDLHGNLNRLSRKSFETLLKYFETGTLTSQETLLLQNEIYALGVTSPEQRFKDSRNSTPHQEST